MIYKEMSNQISNFFADDTMLFSVVHDPNQSAADLNHDLNVINQWATYSMENGI